MRDNMGNDKLLRSTLVYPFSGKPKRFMNPKSLTRPNKKYSFINEKWHIQPATLEIRVFLGLLLSHTQPHNPGMIRCCFFTCGDGQFIMFITASQGFVSWH